MDDKIFDLIGKMHSEMQQGCKEMNGKIDKLDKKINEIDRNQKLTYEEVARTREDMTEARADLRLIKIATVENSKDIEMLKVIK